MQRCSYLVVLSLGCGPAVVTPADTDTNTSMAGETEDPSVGSTTTPTTTVDPTIADTTGDPPPPSTRAVDVLFVVDNSGSMGAEQGRFAIAGAALIAELDAEGLDWRIAFTTTDNGNPWCGATSPEAGNLQLSSCRSRTAEFVFNGNPPADDTSVACLDVCGTESINVLSTPTDEEPDPRPRPWLERTAGQANVEVDVGEAFACFAPQGIAGCGFEQPLESMYKSVLRSQQEGEEQYGFIRTDALLAVVIVTDEADCSYNDEFQSIFLSESEGGNPGVFWSDPDLSAPTSAVCWNAGVTCSGGPGVYDECHAANKDVDGNVDVSDTLAVLQPVSRYADFLQGLEDQKRALDPAQELIVGVIGGVPSGYETGEVSIVYAASSDPGEQIDFGIGTVCGGPDESSRAVPAVREREVAEQFETEDRRNLWSVCDDSYGIAMTSIASMILANVAPG